MMKKIKRAAALMLALLLMLTQAFVVMAAADGQESTSDAPAAEQSDEIYYIKNNYATGAYLYEGAGQLYYGVPTENDTRFQWCVEVTENGSRIKNKATGNYISLSGHGTAESAFADPVVCTEASDGTELWTFEIGEAQNIISANAQYEGFGIHLEEVTDGKVRAQAISGDQLKWGNMKWDFLTAKDINFSASIREGVCIQDASGAYLKSDGASVVTGTPEGPDNSYIWVVEEQKDGSKALKNKATGTYLSINEGTAYSLVSEAAPINFQIGMSSVPAMAAEEPYSTSLLWNVYGASEVANVAGDLTLDGVYCLKNSWYFMYLIDDNGTAVYGNASTSNPAAQWEFIYDEATGLTAVKNVGTGNYLQPSGEGDTLACTAAENYYWKLLRNKSDLYPDAIVLQDSVNETFFVHMENLTGFAQCSNAVQPTWGTPHWVTVLCDTESTSDVGEDTEVQEGYIRFESAGADGYYLYENASGVVVYGSQAVTDARSHWEMVKDEVSGNYYIKNREYGNYVTANKATGTMKCVEFEEVTEGSLWKVTKGATEGSVLISNAYEDVNVYQSPYINIAGLTGSVKSSLESIDDLTTQWFVETAPENTTAVEEDDESGYICLNTYEDNNRYKILTDGSYIEGIFEIEYYGSTVRIKNSETGKYLAYNEEDGLLYKEMESPVDSTVLWSYSKDAGVTVLKSTDMKLNTEVVTENAVYSADEAYVSDGYMTFTIYAGESGDYQADFISETETAEAADVTINGIAAGSIAIPSEGITLSLNKGINTVKFAYTEAIREIKIYDCLDKEYRGVSANYTVYEAETCDTNATVVEDSRSYYDLAAEASGRSAIELDGTGKYIKFTLLEDANALTFRYSVPDSEDGSGADYTLDLTIDGTKTEINMTSKYTWVYGVYPYTNVPSDGLAHNFFDDVTVRLDKTYPAGTEIKISKGTTNIAPYYIVDFIEAELVEEALSQPENSISITEYGAAADDGEDDTEALLDCIDAAAADGKEVWIPAGEFTFNQSKIVIDKDGVTIRGAGMWHTVLTGDYAAFVIKADNTAFYDFSMRGTAVVRRDSVDPAAFEADYNVRNKANLTIQNIWMEHYKVGVWTYNISGVHIVGCRIRNTFADGINLCMATCNSLVEQTSIRGTGDDAMAMWSQNYSDINNTVRYNTIALPDLANCVAIYGGADITICDNIISDSVTNGAGINISTNFDPAPYKEQIIVERNTLNRCGSTDTSYGQDYGAIWFNTVKGFDNEAEVIVRDNVITNSSYQGISFSGGGTVSNVTLVGNAIENNGTWAIDAAADSNGAATVQNNLMRGNGLGTVNSSNEEKFVFTVVVQEEPENLGGNSSDAGDKKVNAGVVGGIAGGAALVLAAGVGTGVAVNRKKSKKSKEQ